MPAEDNENKNQPKMTNATPKRTACLPALATISSFLLLLCLGQQACEAGPAGSNVQLVPGQHQHQAQHQAQHPAQHQATPKQKQSGDDELLGELLRLTAPTTGERQLEAGLSRRPAKKQQLTTKPSKRTKEYEQEAAAMEEQQQQQKRALKRKLHKLLEAKAGADPDEPRPRKSQAALEDNGAEGQDERLAVILIKRKPQLVGLEGGQQPAQTISSNSLRDGASSSAPGQPQQQPPVRHGVNMAEHARRILDDKFDILRHSIFSTNNQLGTKEVPKFGSDEQF